MKTTRASQQNTGLEPMPIIMGAFLSTRDVRKARIVFLTPHQLVPHYDRYATLAFHVYPVVVLRWNEFHFLHYCIMQ
jgi:hypothetical protein